MLNLLVDFLLSSLSATASNTFSKLFTLVLILNQILWATVIRWLEDFTAFILFIFLLDAGIAGDLVVADEDLAGAVAGGVL